MKPIREIIEMLDELIFNEFSEFVYTDWDQCLPLFGEADGPIWPFLVAKGGK